MKVKVEKLEPNPFRRMDEYPIDKEKVESLKMSMEETSFWDNILARPSNSGYQIAYGHHRLLALKGLKVKEVDIPVRDLDDGMMIKIMANENREAYKTNRSVMVETVLVARDWLNEQMKGEWDDLNKSIKILFESPHSFTQSKTHGAGQTTILKFLGGNWKQWEIQEALSQTEETDQFDPESMKPFDRLAVAQEAKTAMLRYKIPKKRQKAVAKMLVDSKVSKHNIQEKVAQIAKAEGYTKEPKSIDLPNMPPMLDNRIEEIIKDVGALSVKLLKVKGYLSHIQNKRLSGTLKTYAKTLQEDLAEILHELGG
jgi:hypothetical protein